MTLVVRAIQVYTIPTGGKGNNRTYTADTKTPGKGLGVGRSAIDIAIVS